jgi:cytoskeletal protein RodZ
MNLERICQELNKTRKEKNFSLEYISSRTKLPPQAIHKIDSLQGLENLEPVYLKGFLKTYAEFLSRQDLIPEIKVLFSPQAEQKQPDTNPKQKRESGPEPDKQKPLSIKPIPIKKIRLSKKTKQISLILLALILLLFSLKLFSPAKQKSPDTKAVSEQTPQKREIPESFPEQTTRSLASILTKEKVFVQVTIDGRSVFSNILDKGTKKSWKADNELKIKINNPSLIVLEINGQMIPTSNQKRSATYIITPQGFEVQQ